MQALAEVLGLTAEQANNAGESIADFTGKQLSQATADAKTAIDQWNKSRRGLIQGNYRFDARALPSELYETVEAYDLLLESASNGTKVRDLATLTKMWGDNFHFVLSSRADAESLVATYQQAYDLYKELSLYGKNQGVDMTQYTGFQQLNAYIEGMKPAFEEAKALLDDLAKAAANESIYFSESYNELIQANKELADA